jgi:hypothetical protein
MLGNPLQIEKPTVLGLLIPGYLVNTFILNS